MFLNNARFYLASSSETPFDSHNNSYESLKDTSEMSFSTPSSSPQAPCLKMLSSQAILPSLTPPITTSTATQSSLRLLPVASSQASLTPKPDSTTLSLLDTSISFAQMMDRTGSPASFLTCSSGWDPGIVSGAVRFPSLLHSKQSIDNFHPTQEAQDIPNEFKPEAQYSLLETKSLPASQSSPKVSFSIATPVYLSPSLRYSPTTSEHSIPSPQTTSPGSNFSLEESTTSSIYQDPFHWDTILAGLPTTPTTPPFVQCHAIATNSPQRDSICSAASLNIIPAIVVRGPDSDIVPTQASVSSIIGLYGDRRESTHAATDEIPTLELPAPNEAPKLDSDEDDTDGEDSSPESEFEIVTVPALKVRLDDILETDRAEVENAFSSLMVRCLLHCYPPS